jgi:RNA polymerase sigma-70 factor (ECF subfamily)
VQRQAALRDRGQSASLQVSGVPFMSSCAAGDITLLLHAWSNGKSDVLGDLIPLVYEELYLTAKRYMSRQKSDHVLQSTALVNEAYLHLAKLGRIEWQDRGHFFAFCARVMRGILTDYARARSYQKRGGEVQHVPFDEQCIATRSPHRDLVALDDALRILAQLDHRKSQVVELRAFGGLSIEATAKALDISTGTVKRDWKLARSWLLRELDRGSRHGH